MLKTIASIVAVVDHLYHAADEIGLPEVKTARDRGTLVTNQLRCNVVPLPV